MSSDLEYIDAGIFIASVNKNHVAYKECEDLLLRLLGERRALTSLATLEEVFHRIRTMPNAETFIMMLMESKRLRKVPLTANILRESIKLVFGYGIDVFDAIAIVTALKSGASVFWTVDVRLIDRIKTLSNSWVGLSRIEFRCPVDIDRLREKSKEAHLQKARRNIENAVLNFLYAMGLKMRREDFMRATSYLFDVLKNTVEKYVVGR